MTKLSRRQALAVTGAAAASVPAIAFAGTNPDAVLLALYHERMTLQAQSTAAWSGASELDDATVYPPRPKALTYKFGQGDGTYSEKPLTREVIEQFYNTPVGDAQVNARRRRHKLALLQAYEAERRAAEIDFGMADAYEVANAIDDRLDAIDRRILSTPAEGATGLAVKAMAHWHRSDLACYRCGLDGFDPVSLADGTHEHSEAGRWNGYEAAMLVSVAQDARRIAGVS